MSSYGVVGRVGVLVEPTFRGVQRKVKDGLGAPLAQEGPRQGRNLGDMIVSGTTRVFKWGGIAAGAALGAAITKGFGRLRAMEDAQAKIRGLGYEAQEVEAIMGDVQGALDGTMFLYSEGADVAAGALAAGVQQGEELEGYLRLTADAATQAGLDFGTMGHMMNKVSSSGKLTGDVLNQLEQNGVYVGAAIADSLGVTQEEFRKMVSAGEVSADVFQEVMYEQFAGSSEEAANTMTGAMSLAWTAVGQLGERLIAEVYPYLRDFFKGFYDWVQEISPAVEDFGKRVGEALGNIIGWLTENPGAVKAFAAAIGAVFAAMAAYTVVTKVTNAFKALNIVMALNPVGVWVAAIAALVVGLIWAWNNVDWFRDAVTAAWEWISDAALWAWENVLSPTIDALVAAWEWVAETFTHVWENYLQPVFEGIGTVFTWLWENILEPYIGFIMGHFQGLGELFMLVWENVLQPVFSWFGDIAMWIWDNVLSHVFSWIGDNWQYMVLGMQMYWEHILKPVFQTIGKIATWLWESVLSPVFSWIGEHWGTILDIMKWAWDFILKPAFMAVAAIATWLWENVLSPVFSWIGEHWDAILFGMKWAWENVLKPAWDFLSRTAQWLWNDVLSPIFTWIGDKWASMSDSISNVYNNYLKPVFDKFGDIVTGLKDKFQASVDNITKVWEKLKGIAAKPIHFVINDVLNEGLIKGFNELKNLIPFMSEDSDIGAIPIPSKLKEAAGFADGGWTGPGGRLDPAGIVHADEFVVRKAARGRFERENPGLLDHVNRFGTLAGYASGGLVRPVSGPLTSRFGAGRGRYPHAGVDWAVPIGTPVKAALAGTVLGHQPVGRTGRYVFLAHPGNRNTYYGHLSRPMVSPGQEVAKGQVIGLSGNTGNSTGPHLHFETWTGGKPVNPLSYMGGLPASASGGETGGGWFDPLAPLRAIGEKIGGWFSDKFPNGGKIVDIAKDSASGALDSVIDWVKDKIPFLGDPEDTAKGMGTVSKGPVQDQVRQVAEGYGWGSGAEWSALSKIIQKESSWNPNAANPSSSARGLFQKMTSAHGPVESTAGGQAKWGLNYIKGRYGSPSRALAFHNRNNWYADGGYVNPLFRDRGGNLPPGLNMVLNKTGRDEAILNSRQWADIHTLAQRGSGGPGVHIENAYALSHKELARDIAIEQRRAKALQLI